MWSRTGLSLASSHYASSPHLFVYQPCDDAADNDTEPSDSGYADSTHSAGNESTPEPIYYTTGPPSTVIPSHKEKEAIRRLSQTYDSVKIQDLGISEDEHCQSATLTDLELLRIETFFRGHKTQVFVCKSLANLYFRSASTLVGLKRYSSQPDVCRNTLKRQENCVSQWELKYTGIPVVLLDVGATRSRDRRRIQLVLAERGTGFTLWSDTIDNLSNYEAAEPVFHTLRVSTDHRLIAGLSFDVPEAARQLFDYMETLTSNPANICLSVTKQNAKRRLLNLFSSKKEKPIKNIADDAKKKKKKLPKKTDISQPCFFQHVTSIDLNDMTKFYSLKTMIHKD